MREFKIAAIAVTLLLTVAAPAFAASAAEFYVDLLQKGIVQFNSAEYRQAETSLRTAAFGLLENTDRYQLAQVYRTIVADKLEDATTAREAARRVLAAERLQPTYGSLSLPAVVRTSFESVAKKILAPAELAQLKAAPAPAVTPKTTTPPPQPQAQPAQTQTQTQTPAKPQPAQETKVAETKPAPKSAPKPAATKPAETPTSKPPTPNPQPPPPTLTQQLSSAERALNSGNLTEARRLFRLTLDANLSHEQAIRIAEGLYRARDFAGVLRAFERIGKLKPGEEPYRFYLAVGYYETGKIAAAKKELAAVLNYIEVTPDVARYRDKIQNAP